MHLQTRLEHIYEYILCIHTYVVQYIMKQTNTWKLYLVYGYNYCLTLNGR